MIKAFDIECFKNYFLIAFRDREEDQTSTFALTPNSQLDVEGVLRQLKQGTLVSFNGSHYDVPMLALALTGASCMTLKLASDAIINENIKAWDFEKRFNVKLPHFDHVDLIEVAPGTASLKGYGGRLHTSTLMDSPVEFDAELTPEQCVDVTTYCVNDLRITLELYEELVPQIELRAAISQQYGVDVRSKSDAQIAEAIIRKEFERRTGERVRAPGFNPHAFRYEPPHWICFEDARLSLLLETIRSAEFLVNNKGAVQMPLELAGLEVPIGSGVYRLGIGGLHSSESSRAVIATQGQRIIDRDVASYYPSLILACNLAPEHLGPLFLDIYRDLVERRLRAKKAKDKVTADCLKIVLNGTFGKLGNMYSAMFSPKLMIQVTLTGQLALLMLIEQLTKGGYEVLSANTDGVTYTAPVDFLPASRRIVEAWEICTGLVTEEVEYAGLYSRDVNNYIAIKTDGTVKTKGVYADEGLAKNPTAAVCAEAAIHFLKTGKSVGKFISACDDWRKFVVTRAVRGGAVDGDDNYLGKTVRWFYGTGGEPIYIKGSGNKVAGTDGAVPFQTADDELFNQRVDLAWYREKAESILKEIGV